MLEADLRPLAQRQRLAQRTVRERFGLVGLACRVQQDRDPGYQRAAQQVLRGGQVEGPPGQVGGLCWDRCRRSASEAFIKVVMAIWSPGAALDASWPATSTGSAPAARRTEATWRSSACTADDGRLARTASRFRSWLKLRVSRPSVSSSLLISSRTGSSGPGRACRAPRPARRP